MNHLIYLAMGEYFLLNVHFHSIDLDQYQLLILTSIPKRSSNK